MATTPVLRLADLLTPGERFHLQRCRFDRRARTRRHGHDFAELFWVEHGRVRHRWQGGEAELATGELCAVRPEDRHALDAVGEAACIVNVAFAAEALDELRRRYGAGGGWPWEPGGPPRRYTMDAAMRQRMAERVQRLEDAYAVPHRVITLDRFLINLLDDLMNPAQASSADAPPPHWLREATRAFRDDPARIAYGRTALVELCGRGGDHVNRELRRCFGVSTTRWVNDARLEEAARRLRQTDDPILAVALDVGLPNLGHFYAQFKRRFGLTPRRYRLKAHAALLEAD